MNADGRLRVGLNLIPIVEGGGGIARYAVELAAALARREDVELHLFTGLDAAPELTSAAWRGRARVTRLPVRVAARAAHLAGQFGAVPALSLARRLDVLHSPANAGPVWLPGVACVITFHDTIWLRAPEQWDRPAAVRTMRRVAVPTARRARRVITGSEDAASDLRELLGIPGACIDVVYHGVSVAADAPATSESPLRERLGLHSGPIVLCLAQKRPYKNQEALIRALADERLRTAQLVLPGAPTPYEGDLRELASELGVAERVLLPPWLSDADVEGLYRLATCVALPSRLEGFGLPVLEAMARGVPVACSDRSALPEVAGEAALLFDPDDVDDVATSIDRLLRDGSLRAALAVRGRQRAASFTWDVAAEGTVASYLRALSTSRRR